MGIIKNWQKGTGAYVVKENVIGQGDLLSGWNFKSGWTIAGGVTSTSPSGFITSSTGGLYRSILTIGKRYRIIFNGTSTFDINLYNAVGFVAGTEIGVGFGTFDFTAIASSIYIRATGVSTVNITTFSVVEIPPLPTITTGSKFLENTSAGTAAIQSNTAYGTREFDYNYSAAASFITFLSLDRTHSNNGYTILTGGSGAGNKITLRRYIGGSAAELMQMANNTLNLNTWYRMKVARLQSEGVFKDIETLQTSDLKNDTYETFTSKGRYGFNASSSTGTSYASTEREISVVASEKYLIEFDAKLISGAIPSLRMSTTYVGGTVSNIVSLNNGRNSHIISPTLTTTMSALFYTTGASSYEVSGLTIRRIYPANTFAVFIKGGAFGDNYTLVSTTGGSGTNPVTDATHTTSEYFVTSMGVGDRIANLKIMDGIEQ